MVGGKGVRERSEARSPCEDIWVVAPKRYPMLSYAILCYPILSLHTNIFWDKMGYLLVIFLDMNGYDFGYKRISF